MTQEPKVLSLTVERLKEVLSYDPSSGEWHWLVTQGRAVAGMKAGNRRPDGYSYIKIDRVLHRTNRLAAFYMTGQWPPNHVDHINGDNSDDRWENLREATPSQNQANRRVVNINGCQKGVHSRGSKYRIIISKDKVTYRLGTSHSREDAIARYYAAAEILYGDFARPISVEVTEDTKALVREFLAREKRQALRSVVCVETGKSYPSISIAAKSHGVSTCAVWAAIQRNGSSGGLHFKYNEAAA
jgi:hypothetical protein